MKDDASEEDISCRGVEIKWETGMFVNPEFLFYPFDHFLLVSVSGNSSLFCFMVKSSKLVVFFV